MPQPYTYYCAAKSAWKIIYKNSDISPACLLGSLGAQPLRCYNLFSKKRSDALSLMADKIETERCGDFLDALISEAQTENEKDYALGFLAHYAADCAFRPYIAALTGTPAENAKLTSKAERARLKFEAALDTYFHARITGVAYVPPEDAMPPMNALLQTEVCALLRRAAAAAYDADLSLEQLCDAFYLYKRLCNMRCSPNNKHGLKVFLTDAFLVKRHGYVKHGVTPAAPPKYGFADDWQNPYTGAQFSNNGTAEILRQSVRAAVGYMHTASNYWQGRITLDNVRSIVGSNVYETGLPCG